jgi:thiamine kinase-like enzyme
MSTSVDKMLPITNNINQEVAKMIAVRACGDDESIEVIDYRLEKYANNTVGFLGNHQRLEITLKKRKESQELVKLSFFVKSVPNNSDEQTYFIKQRRVFNQESEFFNEVLPQLLEVMAVGKIEPWAPKCYLATTDIIVLEDVRTNGFSMRDVKVFEGENLKSTLKAMARLHAASVLVEKKLGKPLNEVYPRACVEQIFNEFMMAQTMNLLESLIKDVAKRSKRVIPDVCEHMKRVFKYMNSDGEGRCRVLCHGDAWPNNFMLDSSEVPKCLLVDYQIVRYAPRMADVAQLIYLSTNREVRRSEERDVIEAYWDEFCETLRKCNSAIERPSFEDIMQEYDDDVKLVGQLTAIMYFPTILLSKEVFAEYKNNPEVLYRKLVFRRNNDCVLELMDKDEDYASRITEIILEFIENCERQDLSKT